ncbi:MAG TPA: choice-of-anchor tandem repeat GloVer-containing protein [Verrucomicrobiae bacterium]|nr:choice-of-anchor tandem repeat GloVer-containing protein [Verrucomicrobiae bacterium]
MKAHFLTLALSLCCILPGARGSIFTTLHSFAIFPQGAQPRAALIQASDGNFYGATESGGTNGGNGTIFRMTPNGTLSTLHTFAGGADGADPDCTLVQGSDGYLYGTCYGGGVDGFGSVFRISTNGSFTTLYSFTGGGDSADPAAGLIQAKDGNLYGTTTGYSDNGAIFRITTGGTLTVIYSFSGGSDGANPYGALVQANDGNLYGTCSGGGDANGDGTLFVVSTNGAFSSLYTFSGGSDGSSPQGALIQGTDGNLYGTTAYGGTAGDGTAFLVTTNGSLTTLWDFSGGSDGANPFCTFVQDPNGSLYGTAAYGGNSGLGAVFNITTNGTLTIVHDFSGGTDGANPGEGLALAQNGTLFGMTAYGNTNNAGTIFKITTKGLYAIWSAFPGMLDGENPSADLAQGKDGNLYGTAEDGGATGNGVVFAATLSGTVTVLHSFGTVTDAVSGALLDGTFPESKAVQGNDGNIYGTTETGGANGYGTVFMVTTNGVFTTLYAFTGGGDGGSPESGLVQGQDGNFYGTTTAGNGTIFQITTNGTFITIYSFSGGGDGAYPYGTLIQGANGLLYGTCSAGGDANGDGTIFQVSTNGAFTTLYTFSGGSDGSGPEAGLVQAADGSLYGTATYGGNANGDGTIFKITTNGVLTTLYAFNGGSDGASPEGVLVQAADGNLYGTTAYAGDANDDGSVFQVTTNGNVTALWDFTGGDDGANPDGGLVTGNNGALYGLTENNGGGGWGTLFLINLAPELQPPTIGNGTLTLNWDAVVGLQYQVQYKTNLAQTVWTGLENPFPATTQAVQVQDSTGPGRQRFYRAVLLP